MSANMSVSTLTQQCLDKFHEAMSQKNDSGHQDHLENRLAGFNLWVDNVGALAKSGASLDSRFRSRPDDLDLVKNILNLLSDFLDENLAKIGIAIRRTGKASRSRKAYQSFNPDEHHEFKQHLECLILLRPNEDRHHLSGLEISSINELKDSPSAESSEKNGISKTKLEQLAKSRMEDLASSKLNEIQKRLVDANLRRRHNFLLAQKRSQRVKKTAQTNFTPDKHQSDIVPLKIAKVPLRAKVIDQANVLASMEPKDVPTQNIAAPTVTGYTIASTAEGTLQFDLAKSQQRAPTVAPSQISFIAANTEFPKPPSSFQSQFMFKCPCCCQSLPSEDFASPSRWRQHLIEDLCPYTCIAQSCPTPDKLFTTRKAWELHFENDHSPQWQCLLCSEDDEPFSSEEDITTHTLTQHKQELSKYELSFLLSSAEVRYMGLEACPLCSSHGPRDSTELVDHVVHHAYEFALRALPWPQSVKENLNKPIGTFSLPEDASNSEQLEKWLDNLEGSAKELSISSFDKMDHSLPEEDGKTLEEDYFANNGYFEDRETADSFKRQTAQGRSSIVWSESSGPDLANQDGVNDPTQAEIDFSAAVSRGDENAVRSMIEDCQTFDSDGKIRKRALMAAVQGGHVAIVKELLGSGIEINSQDKRGQTALFFATERNDVSMVRYLIKSGIDIDIKDHNGLTALHIAILQGDKELISALFTHEIYQSFTDKRVNELLSWAGEKGLHPGYKVLSRLRTRYMSTPSGTWQPFKVTTHTREVQKMTQVNGLTTLIDSMIEPVYFRLLDALPRETKRVSFSLDGKYIATGNSRGYVEVFNFETKKSIFQMDLKTNFYVWGICFSPDGKYLATASRRSVEVFNIATKVLQHYFPHGDIVYALDVSKDGRLLAYGGGSGTVHIWDLKRGVEIRTFRAGEKIIFGVKISPDSSFVAAGGWDGNAYTWDLKKKPSEVKGFRHGRIVHRLTLSSDGKYLVTGGDPSLKLWDLDTGACLSNFENTNSLVTALSMTPDDRWIATTLGDGSVRFWDLTTGRSHCIFDAHKKRISYMAISPLGGYFVTASRDGMRIWSYGTPGSDEMGQ
ncbi:ankyrin repeats (many copies) domain-containing protein [Trichoderma breve]|uniref:Mitochondrial division protein 1 n=1 Tax=Trichoderma breve TaxID=2034170 RepID=A0A9W9B9J4_9HYPO|nr:ankyrin repeats (many copies) domain-containing protein [Trichoderma breve]KAJ4855506.1 ankyrin repeats (many copies) domain-containing protein [Trichoderma breve]